MTHITILTVTIYLHRCVSHRALSVNKVLEHFFRFWSWFTTGQSTRQWASVHRKHHAFCEKKGDPHSPKIYGLSTVLFKGVLLYRKEALNKETIIKYGKFTPDDWLENNLYEKYSWVGVILLLILNLFLFNWNGIWIWLIQMLWIPFWAAGVINGVGHHTGYRNFDTPDNSRNIVPLGLIVGGEELHNNHHTYPISAKLSMKWYEFDIGWFWIKVLSFVGLIRINRVYIFPKFDKNQKTITLDTLQTFLNNKAFVNNLFIKNTKNIVQQEIKVIKLYDSSLNAYSLKKLIKYFYSSYTLLKEEEKKLVSMLLKNDKLNNIFAIKEKMLHFWEEKYSTSSQLLEKLVFWQKEIYENKIQELQKFAKYILWLNLNKSFAN